LRKLWLLTVVAALAAGTSASAAAATPGSLDTAFGTNGITISNVGGLPNDAILAPNGDILVTSINGVSGGAVVRYLPNGKVDTTFGSDGVASISSSSLIVGADGIALAPDGKILVSSGAENSAQTSRGLDVARLNANGTLDTSFGSGGVGCVPLAAGEIADGAVLVQSGGEILTGGSISVDLGRGHVINTGVVVRLTSSGALDTSFGSGGIVSSTTLAGLQTLAVDSSRDVFSAPDSVELNPTGAIDSSVTAQAIVASSQGGPDLFLSNGETDRTGSIGVGRSDTEVDPQRFLANGATDPSFTATEFHFVAGVAARDSAPAITSTPDGKLWVGGSHFHGSSVFGIARLNANGGLDPTFGNSGVETTDIQGDEQIDALLPLSNNNVIAVGFTEDNTTGVAGTALAEYNG